MLRHERVRFLRERLQATGWQPPADEVFSSGFSLLDQALPAGGFVFGELVEWLGKEGAGAGTFALLAAWQAARAGGVVVVLDNEKRFYPPAAAALGIVPFRGSITIPQFNKQESIMPIQVGDKIPSVDLQIKSDGEVQQVNTDALFSGKKVVLFALPGAFTPTCSAAHLPGYVVHAEALFAKGVDLIICLSVNDAHVMQAWGEAHNVEDRVLMLADGNASFTRAVGLEVDLAAGGMGLRSQRYAMVVDDGTVQTLNLEAPREFKVSDAETILASL